MLFHHVCHATHENKRYIPQLLQVGASFSLTCLKFHADNFDDSATTNILVIIVLDDNALKSVSIILHQVPQATRLVLRVFPNLVEIKPKKTERED